MQLPDSIQQTIDNLNLQGATAQEIAKDLIEQANQFAFRLMVASALLEKISGEVKDFANESKEQLQQNAQ
jgi:hypothetical protein